MSALGYWREPLSRDADAKLSWQAPGPLGLQVWIGLLEGRAVARISRQPGHGKGCSAAIDGWMWTEQEPGSAAARLGVKESPTRSFASVPEAKRAVDAALVGRWRHGHGCCKAHPPGGEEGPKDRRCGLGAQVKGKAAGENA
jgi:hypothetical protein